MNLEFVKDLWLPNIFIYNLKTYKEQFGYLGHFSSCAKSHNATRKIIKKIFKRTDLSAVMSYVHSITSLGPSFALVGLVTWLSLVSFG